MSKWSFLIKLQLLCDFFKEKISFLSYTGFAARPAHQRELSSPVSLRSLLHACAGAQGASGPKGTQGGPMGAQGALRAPWAIGG